MKIVLNFLLAVAAVVMAYLCYQSIQTPINFKNEVARRDAVVIQKLKDIRTIQEAYRDKYQVYCPNWKQLVEFAKNDSVPIVNKIGSLTDQQLADGLNEKDAWMYLTNPKKYAKEIDKFGLDIKDFSRDTVFVPLLEKDSTFINRKDFNVDSIYFVPFAQNADTFELTIGSVTTQSGYEMSLFQANVRYDVYLWDLNEQELANKIDDKVQQEKFPGLQVGDATEANNNAGNWE